MSFFRRDFFRRFGLLVAGGLGGRRAIAAAGPRKESSGTEPSLRQIDPVRERYDLIVVGGGIAGTSAAISAARNGVRVALVHNRSMLGGNSSSEVKLFPENNSSHHPWIKESGIHDEFHTEERVRNHVPYVEGTMNCHWDLVLYEGVLREKNLSLYLDAHVHQVLLRDRSHMQAIRAIQLGTEKTFELSAPLFVDATGDGFLAYLAGADYRWGREARREYNEPLAPEEADEKVMGSTLFFRAHDTGRPVPFHRPEWAAEFPTEADLTARTHSFIDGGYWWIEVGAPHHPIRDNAEIRHELLRQLLGAWDHIKNRGEHGAENHGLEFVGFWPYKRECRRILGDYVLTQHDVQDPQSLEDAVAYGCWYIDVHVQGGILARDKEPYPPGGRDENWQDLGTQPYGIPLRALYSRNVENLMMAGRPISASYLAFASTRVLSTGSIVGQAVGVAASLCKKYGATPRVVAREHAGECRRLILHQDGHIPGAVNEDPRDLARQARVTAGSEWLLEFPEPSEERRLTFPHAQLFPISAERLDRVELMLRSERARPANLRLRLRPAPHVWDFRSEADVAAAETAVPPNFEGWVPFDLNARVEPGRLYYVYTEAAEGIYWKSFREVDGEPNRIPPGTTAAYLPSKTPYSAKSGTFREIYSDVALEDVPGAGGRGRWKPLTLGRSLCLRITPESRPYSPENVIRGTHRPDRWTNIWVSDPTRGLPAWLELGWPSRRRFNTVQLTFDTDANRRVTLPLFRYPDCVEDYRLEYRAGGSWQELVEVRGNYVRQRRHQFDPVESGGLRLTVLATNGARSARIYEVRVYDEEPSGSA